MSSSALKPATYADLMAVPDNLVAEILAGGLYTSPRPAPRHALAASVIGADIGAPFHRGRGGPGGWWILFEPELHLGPDILVPDFAGWRRERMPTLPDEAYFSLAPDWVCEVLSPSTGRIDRMLKMPIYAQEGVNHIWLVDPIARTLEVFRRRDNNWLLVVVHGDDQLVRAEPFDAVELDLLALWGEERPPAEE